MNTHEQRKNAPSMFHSLKNKPPLYSGTVFIEYTKLYRSRFAPYESMKSLPASLSHETVIQSARFFPEITIFLMISVKEVTLASQRGVARGGILRLFFAQD